MSENIEVTKKFQEGFGSRVQFYRVKLKRKKLYELSKRIIDIVFSFIALWFYHLSYFGLLLGYIWKSRENQSFFPNTE